ncbi:CDP-diacylglycerol--glycerol-3-phosphate 3-phosphatidyltransferase [Streptomyces ziwulingensis]|uniref:CDP-diacylglycerol--glycerol-3-phosphate 3-phosphatidyltransferase n=1 Tax=Streptomyces ziwulingensis TaxID=1045501 RepID=A0ABP9CZY4_9ACTN
MTGAPASAAGGPSGARRAGPPTAPGSGPGAGPDVVPGAGERADRVRQAERVRRAERVERADVSDGDVARVASGVRDGDRNRGGDGKRDGDRNRGGGGEAAGRGAVPRGGKITAAAVNQASVWNVANLLTMLRLILVPAFVALMLGNGGHDPAWRSFAWASFAVAMITDLFDGHLARTYNLVTDFGKIADPIADKAIMGAALICLSALDDLPWWVTAVILGREIGITLMRFLVIRYGVIPASRGGKLKTLTQGVAVGMYVLALTGPLATLRFWVMAVAVVLTVASGLDYVKQAIVLRREGIAERRAALRGTDA